MLLGGGAGGCGCTVEGVKWNGTPRVQWLVVVCST